MGILDSIARLFRANVNAAISAVEQPEKMLTQIIADMRTQLIKAKQQVAAAIADEKRLEDQTMGELREAEEWERRAMLAVKEGRDELAKQALMRRNEHVSRGQQMQMTWEAHKQETDRLKNSLRDLNDNIEEANRKKTLLLARQRRAEAQKRISETMSSMSDKSAFDAFARMEEKIEQNERQIAASVEIDQEFSGDALSNQFKQLESSAGDATADLQLSQLKQKMGLVGSGQSSPSRQIGAGEVAPDAPRELSAPAEATENKSET
ncbi:MAG: PspA/IM30 family protein [Gemmatimonadales bacterium]|jgi:phage shock protein A